MALALRDRQDATYNLTQLRRRIAEARRNLHLLREEARRPFTDGARPELRAKIQKADQHLRRLKDEEARFPTTVSSPGIARARGS